MFLRMSNCQLIHAAQPFTDCSGFSVISAAAVHPLDFLTQAASVKKGTPSLSPLTTAVPPRGAVNTPSVLV